MKYSVEISIRGQSDISQAFGYIAVSSPGNAIKWLAGLNERIESLETFPRRYGQAREQDHLGGDYRQLVYKSHRIVYLVDEASKTVGVVCVRHAAMRTLGEPETEAF